MKLLSAVLTLSFVSLIAAIQLVPRAKPRVARLDIQRRDFQDPLTHDRTRKRQKTVQQSLVNVQTSYYADVSLGTPGQNFRLHINTGASDMWVNTANSTLCSTNNNCGNSGTYSANRSSTYKYVNGAFNISYTDGEGAAGDHATDTLSIGGQVIRDMQFGIAYTSTARDALLGIGYAANEVQVASFGLAPYENLPQRLVKDGKINSNAYSLWLNDLAASSGTILFGGVDTAKYTGRLQSIPIIPTQGVYREFNIALTAVGQNGTYDLMNNRNIAALLESGTSLTYLPENITTTLFQRLNARYSSSNGAAIVNCTLPSQAGTIDFSFSGVNISVPLQQLVIPAGESRGQPVCILGIAPVQGNNVVTLGDSFLRAAYVVYDLDNNEISLAQTKYNVTTEKIVEIARGSNGVPTSVFETATSVPTARGSGASGSATSTPTGTDGGEPSKGLSTGAKAGIGVGVVVGVAVLVGAALLLIKRRRKSYAHSDVAKSSTAQASGDLPEFMGQTYVQSSTTQPPKAHAGGNLSEFTGHS